MAAIFPALEKTARCAMKEGHRIFHKYVGHIKVFKDDQAHVYSITLRKILQAKDKKIYLQVVNEKESLSKNLFLNLNYGIRVVFL